MTASGVPSDSATLCRSKANRRMRGLVAFHALLAVVPGALAFVPANGGFFPAVIRILASITTAQLMLLGFWGGFGNGKAAWRLVVVVLAVAYTAIWSTLGLYVSAEVRQPGGKASLESFVALLATQVSTNSAVALLISAAFLAVRRRWSEMRFLPNIDDHTGSATIQFSILNVLAITTVAAILFAFVRGARKNPSSGWEMAPVLALMVSTLVIDTVCAVWATLGIGRVRWRVALTLTVAALLGLLLHVTAVQPASWWETLVWTAVFVLSIAIVVASLLVVRSCGYRLVAIRAVNEQR